MHQLSQARNASNRLIAKALQSHSLLAAGVFLVVFSAMVLTVEQFGVAVPFYDEWDAEAVALYKPYEEGTLHLSNLFAPHNGHLILFTRLTALTLYVINGGWDPQLQMLVSGFLHALTAALLTLSMRKADAPYPFLVALAFTLALYAIPFSWMSILVAFQTQFYFMILFSLSALSLLLSGRYVAGYVFAFLACLSMTPGAFVLLAFIGVLFVDACRDQKISRARLIQLCISCMLFLAFVFIHLNRTSSSAEYQAQDPGSFLVSLISAFCWPFRARSVVGVLIYVPFLVLLVRSFFVKPECRFLIGAGLFVMIQIISIAYFRGEDGVPPANRYWEILLIGVWANSVSLLFLLRRSRSASFRILTVLWVAVMASGMSFLAHDALSLGLPERRAQSEQAGKLIREYLVSEKPTVFSGFSGLEISYPNPEVLINIVSDPTIRQLLPKAIISAPIGHLGNEKYWLFRAEWLIGLLGITLLAVGLRKPLPAS